MEAVILRQSVQLQMKVVTKPGSRRGLRGLSEDLSMIVVWEGEIVRDTTKNAYKSELYGTTKASGSCFIVIGPADMLRVSKGLTIAPPQFKWMRM